MPRVTAVIGGQYGSEGKGVIVAKIADRFDTHVRAGGPNAGHSFFHKGKKWVMQAIPCGWINRDAIVYIAPGGLVSLEVLAREFKMIYEADPTIKNRLLISNKAGIISDEHHHHEGGVHGEIHQRIGSTGEGIGAARVARINREKFTFVKDHPDYDLGHGVCLGDVTLNHNNWLPSRIDGNYSVLLEGTQGFGLSLIHGPWPYVTSNDVSAAQMCADVGISPRDLTDVLMVVRTYPIRVAGNSGPLAGELTWDQISSFVGKPVIERTTVTKKVRRIGGWDEELFLQAIAINRPTSIACTFMDYIDPTIEGADNVDDLNSSPRARSFVEYMELVGKVRVQFVGTGGPQWSVIER